MVYCVVCCHNVIIVIFYNEEHVVSFSHAGIHDSSCVNNSLASCSIYEASSAYTVSPVNHLSFNNH